MHGDELIGFHDAWDGVMERRFMTLDVASLRGMLPRGGTLLGTRRGSPYDHTAGLDQVRVLLRQEGAERLSLAVVLAEGENRHDSHQRLLQRSGGDAQAHGGVAAAFEAERGHQLAEAALGHDQIVLRHAYFIEIEVGKYLLHNWVLWRLLAEVDERQPGKRHGKPFKDVTPLARLAQQRDVRLERPRLEREALLGQRARKRVRKFAERRGRLERPRPDDAVVLPVARDLERE